LDAIDPFGKGKIKHSVLRIKPLVMKRRWRNMSIKRKKNSDEPQHVETSLSLLPLDEGEVVQPCFPHVHEVEEAVSLNDEGFGDPVEVIVDFVLPAHEDKEMVIFTHIVGHMKKTLDMVDVHIYTFI
jgi:hypothetical protein